MKERELEQRDLDDVVGGGECEVCNPNPGGLRRMKEPLPIGGAPDPTAESPDRGDAPGDFDRS